MRAPAPPAADDAAAARGELLAALAIAAAATALRVACLLRWRVNTDEPQHLHVAWGWAEGRVPYRDFFDNHMPLFHLLSAPLVSAIGEDPAIVLRTRVAMLPLWAAMVAATWAIARTLASPRAALRAAAVAALVPPFFLTSLEYRVDVLWAALWLGALALLAGGRATRSRALAAGVPGGAALAASVKTLFLLAALAAGLAAAAARAPRPEPRRLAGLGAAAAAGAAAVWLPLAAFLAAEGALGAWLDCVFFHNASGYGLWTLPAARLAAFAAIAAATAALAPRVAAAAPDERRARRRLALFVAAGGYLAAANGLSPIVNNQDFLPLVPLAVALAAAHFDARLPAAAPLVLLAVGTLEIAAIAVTAAPWRDRAASRTALLADVLALARPGEAVVDLKGETVFRPRAPDLVLEAITLERIRAGALADDVAADVVARGARVAVNDGHVFPPAARRFLLESFVPVGRLRVAGKLLEPDASGAMRFEVALAARYAVVGPEGEAAGRLDGTPYDGPRRLEAGPHVFEPRAPGRLAVVWARAVDLGYSPFRERGETLRRLGPSSAGSPAR